MTTAQPDGAADTDFVTRSEERLQLTTEWVSAQRVVARRQIVTETVTLTVDIRREELVFDQADIHELPIQQTPLPYVKPLVITLREEIPTVSVTTRPYEQVTVSVVQVKNAQDVAVDMRRERFELQTDDTAGAHRRPL